MAEFLVGDDLNREIYKILKEDGCKCAVAFWGAGAVKKFGAAKNLKLICNLESGGTNPHEIKKILALPGAEIKQCNNLHAKVYVGKSKAIVASANISANGLGIEGAEQAFWIEAGVLLNDTSAADVWFEDLWASSSVIGPEHIRIALKRWKLRQILKPAAPEFEDWFARKDKPLPLLDWYGDREWNYGQSQLGDFGPDIKNKIDDSLHLERKDHAVFKESRWVLQWKREETEGQAKNEPGLVSKQPRPEWFFSGAILKNGFKYKDEKIPRDCVLPADVIPPEPFSFREPYVHKAFLNTLAREEYDLLRSRANHNTFYTDERLKLCERFWTDLVAEFRKLKRERHVIA